VWLTARRSVMGSFTNRRSVTFTAWVVAFAVVVLNVTLIYLTVST
jgi:manganese transport protein